MAKLSIVDLDAELRKGSIRPFYIIVGEEAYLAQTALKRIEDVVLGNEVSEFAKRSFFGKEVSQHELLDHIRAIPLLGGRTLTIVKEAQGLTKETFEALTQYIESPLESTIVTLVADKLDGRSRLMQAASKNPKTAIIECKPLYANQVPSWVNMEVSRLGKKISQDAAHYLADMVGQDLGQIVQAIERIILYVGNRPTIEVKDVEEAIAETTQRSIFELTDAIGRRNLTKALATLTNLLEHGTAPVLILNMIARHFRILVRAREVESRGNSREVASYLGVNPFFAKDYIEQCRNFSASDLRKKFGILARCDRELKSSRIPKERILERLMFDAINSPQRHR
jgi:DNA polymerase-3 subunit delta